jgi:hypothetical protein
MILKQNEISCFGGQTKINIFVLLVVGDRLSIRDTKAFETDELSGMCRVPENRKEDHSDLLSQNKRW